VCARWFGSPAAGVLQAAGRNSGLHHVRIKPLRFKTSQPSADQFWSDFTLAAVGSAFHPGTGGVGVSGGCWGGAGTKPASLGLPLPQPLEMIVLHSPKTN